MNKIVVLGSNSFAGSQFVSNSLALCNEMVGINRSAEQSDIFLSYKKSENISRYEFRQLDLNQNFSQIIDFLAQFRPDVVVDFAGQGMVAESWQQPEQWYQTNVLSKVRLHNYLKDQSWLKKYIRISTPEVYGSCEEKIKESFLYNPSTPYAVSHAAIDMSLKAFQAQYDFPVIFTRFSNFYGPGQQLYRIIPRTIIYAVTGRKLQLHGGGKAVRAFIHGNDIASAINASINSGKVGEVYHFSTDSFVTIKQLVELIHNQLGADHDKLVEVSQDRPGKDLKYLMDDCKAQTELNWQPKVSLIEGIKQTIKWVEDNLEEISALPLDYQHKV
jgi:dTDP-glucose 4,6-dehydratase